MITIQKIGRNTARAAHGKRGINILVIIAVLILERFFWPPILVVINGLHRKILDPRNNNSTDPSHDRIWSSPAGISTGLDSRILPLYGQIDHYFEKTISNESAKKTHRWFHTYLRWHHQMRMEYPDTNLFDNSTGPRLAIVYFDPNTHRNGLSDRMISLG
jgi:hypothetical protein